MKTIFITLTIIVAFFVFNTSAQAKRAQQNRHPELWGDWEFEKAVRTGHEIFPPGMAEHIEFSFDQDGYDSLTYKDELGRMLCQRHARYEFDGQKLVQRTTWVYSGNDSSCAGDPDMQLGKTATNTAYVKNHELHIDILLSDDVVSYIWKRKTNQKD